MIHVKAGPLNLRPEDIPPKVCDPHTYLPSIQYLISQGFDVALIGDMPSKPLPTFNGFYDLTCSPRDPSVDITLMAHAQFAICTHSGPVNTPSLFGTPLLLTNSLQIANQACYPLSFQLPKTWYIDNCPVHISQLYNLDLLYLEVRSHDNYILVDCTEGQILDATCFMTQFISADPSTRHSRYIDHCSNYSNYVSSCNQSLADVSHLPIVPTYTIQ